MKSKVFIKRSICLLLFVVFLLSVFDSTDYKKAVELQGKGKYSDAAKLFESLGEYEDSPDRLVQCRNMSKAVDTLDKKNAELDELINTARKTINCEDKALDETLREKLETSVSDAKAVKIVLSEYPKTKEETVVFIQTVSDSDYSTEVSALKENTAALQKSIKQNALVNAPSEAYIIKCLKNVKGVINISAVTEDNDPNGNLNKAHSYTAAVYFSHKNVNQKKVSGKTVIEKGTDCGGCVEVYATEEDAKKRDEYLGAFDGTILASGSHIVIGTVVVRTSDKMKASQQKKVEKEVIAELTRVDE